VTGVQTCALPICFSVTDQEIERAIRENHLKTVEEVTYYTKAGGGCGGCIDQLQAILDKVNGVVSAIKHTPTPPRMTNLQKIEKIKEILEKEVRPLLKQDGGDCELVDVDGNDVYIKFIGHCAGCAFSHVTQEAVIRDLLRKHVLPNLEVKQA
jgi:NifU-like protein